MSLATRATRPSPARAAARLATVPTLSGLRQVVLSWSARRRQRLALARLDAHLLHDSLDPRRAADEAARRFWTA